MWNQSRFAFKSPQSSWDASIKSVCLFANFYFVFLFSVCFSLPMCVPESVLHSLSLTGLTLQMRYLCHICQEVWFELNFNFYKFSDTLSYQLSAVICNRRGTRPQRGGIRTADLRCSENPLLYNSYENHSCAGSPKGSINQGLWYHAAEEQIISPGFEV